MCSTMRAQVLKNARSGVFYSRTRTAVKFVLNIRISSKNFFKKSRWKKYTVSLSSCATDRVLDVLLETTAVNRFTKRNGPCACYYMIDLDLCCTAVCIPRYVYR